MVQIIGSGFISFLSARAARDVTRYIIAGGTNAPVFLARPLNPGRTLTVRQP
jgi:hypothetical protein